MLVELSIDPLGRGTHLSHDLAEILKIVDGSGLDDPLTVGDGHAYSLIAPMAGFSRTTVRRVPA